ncbi:Phage protein [hydrothermal vent metagenome]|uniref:Phage protein n=1 Tax=hydrothermal vent metagenome TaxID=652676 RepID=A0A3B0YCE2_9ZZZZ
MGAAKKLLDKKVLKDLVPLNALSAVHLEEISRKAIIETVRAGRYVLKAGDRDYQSVYLLEGKVELVEGGREVVGSVVSGTEAARHPLVHKQPRQHSVRASGSVTVARVDSSLLDVLLTWDESSGYDVVEIDAEDGGDWMTRMLQSQAFLQLPPSNIHQLLMRLEAVSVRAGDVIVKQDDDGEYFYIVKSGRMAVSRKASARSKEVLLAELGEGACFGEEALVSGTRRNATVTMLTDGSLMRLSKEDFDELLCAPLVHEVDYAEASQLAEKGALWLDVRLPGEFGNQSIKGSRNLPLSALREQADTLNGDEKYIVCCDTGRRSASGAFILGQYGLDVFTLRNGLMDVPGEALTGTSDAPPLVDTPAREADILPFETDAVPDETEASASRKDTGDTEALNEQLKAAEVICKEQQVEAEALRRRVELLEGELSDSKAQQDVLAQTLEKAKQAGDSAAEVGGEAEKQRLQMESELARVRDDYQQLGQRTSAVAGERDAASRELEEARSELTGLKARLDSQQGEISEQVSGLQSQLDDRASELESEIALRGKIETVLAEAEKSAVEAKQRETGLLEQIDQLGQTASEKEKLLQENIRAQLEERDQALTVVSESRDLAQQKLEALEQEMGALRQSLDSAGGESDEIKSQLTESVEREKQLGQRVTELEQQQASSEGSHESELGSAREAMTRAQTELENLKREQQRLLNRQRKAEEALDRERHDHQDEVHRLHKEMKAAAGDSAEGLAAEMEALQAQVSEGAGLRDELEIQLGERSAQVEEAQLCAEQLEQQLKLAKQGAREAEQQLLESNRLANEEMEIRLNTEQGVQQGLRGALEVSEKDRDSHQETITVINQELEELRDAYQQSKQALENKEGEAESRLVEVQTGLDAALAERDELLSSAESLKSELDQLRAEAEVHRGLEGMLSDEDSDSEEHEALQQAKQNVEMAVRLRTQAEEQIETLNREVEQLKEQLNRASEIPAPVMVEGAIPSLDDNDPHASNPMLPDDTEFENHDTSSATVLLDEEILVPSLSPVQVPKSGLLKGMLTGLVIGGVVGAGLLWWQIDSGKISLSSAIAPVVTVKAPTAEQAPAVVTPKPVKQQQAPVAPIPVEKKKALVDQPALATGERVGDIKKPAPVASNTLSGGMAAISNTSRTFPLARGMPDIPGRTIEPESADKASANVRAVSRDPEPVKTAENQVAEPVVEPVVVQPAGRFRDRLSNGGAGPAMVRFRADHYLMGSSDVSPQFNERPQHDVRLRSFAIAANEITFDEYDAFARAAGRDLPSDDGQSRGKWPVVNVSWEDALAYTQWLSVQTGVRYRLPSEAEWEFVARSGTVTRYWWGEESGKDRANCFDCGSSDGGVQTSRVGSFTASPWGVYDMAGNAREWVQDCYVPNYSRAPADGRAVEVGACTNRVVRGGAYSSPSDQLRSTSRDQVDAKRRLDNLGFRVVREY